jgi:hypothetical protein
VVLGWWQLLEGVHDGGRLASTLDDSGACPVALQLDEDRAASPQCLVAPPGDGLARAAAKIMHEDKFITPRV